MNKVTLLAIIALTMVGSLVFKAWQRTPVPAIVTPQPKTMAVASASANDEAFRVRLRQIVARARASAEKERLSAEKDQIFETHTNTTPEKTFRNP